MQSIAILTLILSLTGSNACDLVAAATCMVGTTPPDMSGSDVSAMTTAYCDYVGTALGCYSDDCCSATEATTMLQPIFDAYATGGITCDPAPDKCGLGGGGGNESPSPSPEVPCSHSSMSSCNEDSECSWFGISDSGVCGTIDNVNDEAFCLGASTNGDCTGTHTTQEDCEAVSDCIWNSEYDTDAERCRAYNWFTESTCSSTNGGGSRCGWCAAYGGGSCWPAGVASSSFCSGGGSDASGAVITTLPLAAAVGAVIAYFA